MRKIRQVLRLGLEAGMSQRSISSSLAISRAVVTDYLTRAAAAELTWPLPADMDDAKLEGKLFPLPVDSVRRPEPNWELVHQELRAKGGTLQVLHQEFLAEHPFGVGYSLFCERYRQWQKSLKRYMRQPHVAGERVFVDYAGPTIGVHDPKTGETRKAQIFVGILGASNYTYAEAHWSQQLPNWIAAHTRMFEFFGGSPKIVVCDNLKSAVTKASRTEPVVHPAYQHLAEHYGTAILPARPRKPKDKSKVENAVLVVERWVLFRLRKRVFITLADLNAAIAELLAELNERPFQKLAGCRRSQFEVLDQPVLLPLPAEAFEYTEFRRVRVGLDGCFAVDDGTYSVPFALCKQSVDLRITAATIEVLHLGQRVASHVRADDAVPVIDPQHLRPNDRHFSQWNTVHELEWALSVGTQTQAFLQLLFSASTIKEQGYRSATALKRLQRDFGAERLEGACGRAIAIGANSLSSVRSILRTGLDQQQPPGADPQEAAFDHPNVRGSNYYH